MRMFKRDDYIDNFISSYIFLNNKINNEDVGKIHLCDFTIKGNYPNFFGRKYKWANDDDPERKLEVTKFWSFNYYKQGLDLTTFTQNLGSSERNLFPTIDRNLNSTSAYQDVITQGSISVTGSGNPQKTYFLCGKNHSFNYPISVFHYFNHELRRGKLYITPPLRDVNDKVISNEEYVIGNENLQVDCEFTFDLEYGTDENGKNFEPHELKQVMLKLDYVKNVYKDTEFEIIEGFDNNVYTKDEFLKKFGDRLVPIDSFGIFPTHNKEEFNSEYVSYNSINKKNIPIKPLGVSKIGIQNRTLCFYIKIGEYYFPFYAPYEKNTSLRRYGTVFIDDEIISKYKGFGANLPPFYVGGACFIAAYDFFENGNNINLKNEYMSRGYGPEIELAPPWVLSSSTVNYQFDEFDDFLHNLVYTEKEFLSGSSETIDICHIPFLFYNESSMTTDESALNIVINGNSEFIRTYNQSELENFLREFDIEFFYTTDVEPLPEPQPPVNNGEKVRRKLAVNISTFNYNTTVEKVARKKQVYDTAISKVRRYPNGNNI